VYGPPASSFSGRTGAGERETETGADARVYDETYFYSSSSEGRMSEFQTVCKLADLPDGEGKAVPVGRKVIAVFRVGGEVFAIDDVCPHMGASLSGGYVEQGVVTCPWHAWRFRLKDGTWADYPKVKITCYPVRVEGDDVQVQIG
jgi:nitrite reductase (NADH) small subunit/3-phenylpropionate/trans-cinnamate dioxygenase ferredoxin subunit